MEPLTVGVIVALMLLFNGVKFYLKVSAKRKGKRTVLGSQEADRFFGIEDDERFSILRDKVLRGDNRGPMGRYRDD